MASFVEQAVLRVVDQSTKEIKAINTALNNLFKTAKKGRSLPIKFTGAAKAKTDINSITAALNKMRAAGAKTGNAGLTDLNRKLKSLELRKPISIPIKLPGALTAFRQVTQLNHQLGLLRNGRTINTRINNGRSGLSYGDQFNNTRPQVRGRNTAFPGNLLSELNFQAARITINAAGVLIRTGATAALEAQATETQRQIIINDPAAEAQILASARTAALATNRISLTRAQQVAQDAYTGGLRGAQFDALVPTIIQQEATATLLGGDPAAARAQTLLANKTLNLANATDDVARSMDILAGVQAGAIVQGESFNATTTLAALRTAGFANTISGDGLVGFSLAVDSLGQRAGSSLNRLNKELVTPLAQAGAGAGIAKGAVESLIAGGLRGESGITDEQARRFKADPLAFIQTDIREAFIKNGVDVNDQVAVAQAAAKAGFSTNSQRLITEAISAISEYEKARALAANIRDPAAAEDAAANDLGAALKNMTASFNTFSSEVLVPVFERIAPLVNGFANTLESIALDDGPLGSIKRLGVATNAAVAALGLLAGTKFLADNFSPIRVAGTSLITAGTQLQSAAAALARGAVVPNGGGTPVPSGGPLAVKGPNLLSQLNVLGTLTLIATAVEIQAISATLNQEDPVKRLTAIEDEKAKREKSLENQNGIADKALRAIFGDSFTDLITNNGKNKPKDAFAPTLDLMATKAKQEIGITPTRRANDKLIELADNLGFANEELAFAKKTGTGDVDQLIIEMEAAAAALDRAGVSSAAILAAFASGAQSGEAALATLPKELTFVDYTSVAPVNNNSLSFGETTAQVAELPSVFSDGSAEMLATFNTGAAAIGMAADGFGPVAGQGILAVAPIFGQIIGAAAAAAISNASIYVPTSPLNSRNAAIQQPADRGAMQAF